MEKTLNLIKNDPWLEPFAGAITGRHQHVLDKEAELTNKGKQTLSDFASGYLYFGLHRTDKGWTFREWAPNATHIYMVGTFNNWEEKAAYKLKKLKNGNWEINLPAASQSAPVVDGKVMEFVIFAIESAAQKLGIPAPTLYNRLEKLNLIRQYLISGYDMLHTQSREYIADTLVEALENWEAYYKEKGEFV